MEKKTLKRRLAEHAGLKYAGLNFEKKEEFIGSEKEWQIFESLQNLSYEELRQSGFKIIDN